MNNRDYNNGGRNSRAGFQNEDYDEGDLSETDNDTDSGRYECEDDSYSDLSSDRKKDNPELIILMLFTILAVTAASAQTGNRKSEYKQYSHCSFDHD